MMKEITFTHGTTQMDVFAYEDGVTFDMVFAAITITPADVAKLVAFLTSK